MTVTCVMPDGNIGVALRMSQFFDCQARALGENGFQALAGGPLIAGLLSGLVTIFVALIGYRLILGTTPNLSEGVVRMVRLGFVLALATGWPAFQTLVYRVAVDGPGDLATIVMPAAGLPQEDLAVRVQQAYDTMRLGSGGGTQGDTAQAAGSAASSSDPGAAVATISQGNPFGQTPLPQTASWFAISTVGVTGGLRVAAGFLLAVAPLAIMALLFDATLGLFSGWLRALAGSVLAGLAATIVAAIDLLLVEGELGHVQGAELGTGVIDPQALTTIVLAGVVVMIVATFMAGRMAGAIRIAAPASAASIVPTAGLYGGARYSIAPEAAAPRPAVATIIDQRSGGERTRSVADAFAASARREQIAVAGSSGGVVGRSPTNVSMRENTQEASVSRIGTTGRRGQTRQTRSAARRDRTG